MNKGQAAARIMIVEDEVIIAREIRMILERLGYEVTSISNSGEQAVARADRENPDVILMDINLKGSMDGIEAAGIIRERLAVPVIYVTASAEDRKLDRAKQTTPAGYILKPFTDQDLKVTLEIALHVSAAYRERDNALKELRESEAKFRLTFDASPDAVNINRLEDGLYVAINQGFCRLTGYTREEIIGRSSVEINIWEDSDLRKRLVRDLREKGFCDNLEGRFRCKDGSIKTALMSARVIELQGVPHIISITRDITERKQAELERERLLTAIRHSGEMIVVTDPEGTIQFVNQAFETITGYSAREVIGRNPRILKSGRQDRAFYRDLWATITSGATFRGRMINKCKDGSIYTEEAVISPVHDNEGRIVNFVAVKRDITGQIKAEEDLRRSEERLRQSQRMESIGTLAGGIAHDFNNILYPIIGHSEMLVDDLEDNPPLQDRVRAIMNSALRAAGLVKQILSFSRQQQKGKVPVMIQEIIHEVLLLIRHSIPAFIDIELKIDATCPAVMADAGQIHQVIMNLISNANLAMEGTPGKMVIGLTETQIGPDALLQTDLPPGPYVDLYVSDTGAGMDDVLINRIFDPFFTTREVGKGTGLGLSVSYGIVKQHGGVIRVESWPGRGSVFHVYLPVMTDARAETAGKAPAARLEKKGATHILFVDDSRHITELVEPVLNRLGYRVTCRSGAVEALETFRDDPDRFDLVITDMSMPNMTGVQLAVEIRRIRSDMPIVICTGFSEQIDDEKARALGINAFLLKPVARDQLAAVIHEVLNPS